jgi:hypothetical protein
MSTITLPTPIGPVDKTGTNEPVALATYSTADGVERAIFLQRVEGQVCLTDAPASGRGRCRLIEDQLTSNDELVAIATDYLHQAEQRGGTPAGVLL